MDIKSAEKNKSLKKAGLTALLLLSFSVIFALFIAEFLIKFTTPQLTLKQARLVNLKAFQASDFLPFELIPNLHTRHISDKYEFDYQLSTNSLGLRGKQIAPQKDKHSLRILMIGDSMTFGWGIKDDQTFSIRLEEKLNQYFQNKNIRKKVEVINAGFAAGFAPDTYYLYLKSKALKLQPDLVVVNYFPRNDISDLFETKWDEVDQRGFPLKISSDEKIVSRGYLTSKQGNWKYRIPLARDSHLGILFLTVLETKMPQVADYIKISLLRLPKTSSKVNDEQILNCVFHQKCSNDFSDKRLLSQRLLKQIKLLTDEAGTPLLVTILPDPYQVKLIKQEIEKNDSLAFIDSDQDILKTYPEIFANLQPQTNIITDLSQAGISYLDPLSYLITRDSSAYFYNQDGHYTAQGAEQIANSYFDFFSQGVGSELLPVYLP